MTPPTSAAPGRSFSWLRRRLLWRLLALAVVVALGYFGVQLLVGNFDEVLGAADLVTHPQTGWLAVAVAAEIASYVTYAAAQGRLLRAQGRRIGLGPLSLLAIAAQALGVCVPGGYAVSNVFSYRILRRYDVDEFTAGRVLIMSAALYVAALALLAVVGAQVAGDNGPVHDVSLVAYSVLGVVALLVGIWLLRPRQLRRLLLSALERVEARLAMRRPGVETRRLSTELAAASELGRGTVAISGLWLLGAWIGDIGCLVASFGAVGATPPWHGLLLAYCGAQLAALLPITPGGLGVVEGSLTLALVSFGGGQVRTVAAVLLYRLISFWGLIPSGAASYGLLRTRWVGARARAATDTFPAPEPAQ